MRSSILAIYAVPVALLLMAGGLATPSASAEPEPTIKAGDAVKGVFSYDRHASAATIYASLQHKAERLCALAGVRRADVRKRQQASVASLVASGVSRIGRADLAELHGRNRGQG